MDDLEKELQLEFLEESIELLEEAEEAFIGLDKDRQSMDLLNQIFRLAHNLKGTASAVGLEQIAELTHSVENVILKIKEGEIPTDDNTINALFKFKDRTNEIVGALKEDIGAIVNIKDDVDYFNSIANHKDPNTTQIKEAAKESEAKSELAFTDISDFEDLDIGPKTEKAPSSQDKFEELIPATESEPTPTSLGVAPAPETAKIKPAPEATKPATQQVPKQNSAIKKAKEGNIEESIRVKLSRIDKLNNIVGEMVILQTVLNQRRFAHIVDDLSNKSISQLNKLVKEAQELSMSLRMVPMKTTFQKMQRIIRDTSMTLKKKISTNFVGEDTEVDKAVAELLSDPLVHMIRNSVDHGVETPELRVQAGKTEAGTVELMAYQQGNNLVIQITDDGKGIHPQKIEASAIEKGVLKPNHGLNDQELIQLIFHPGFSTKEKVTEISGRGVGMDVVRQNIERLGGTIKVMSKVNEGSSFKITLPLSMSVIDGIVIRSNDRRYVIPLDQAHELTRITDKNTRKVQKGGDYLNLRGKIIPIFNLNNKLGSKYEDNGEHIAVVINTAFSPVAIIIDDILNQQQIVVKKLGDELKDKKGYLGSAILGDGKPAFILDLYHLFENDIRSNNNFKQFKDEQQRSA